MEADRLSINPANPLRTDSDQLSADRFGMDHLSIETPELVAIELPLAGIGSRFIALLVDYLIWGVGFTFLSLLLAVILPSMTIFSRLSAQWAMALVIFFFFLVNWGYFTLFEAFWNGRTPGRRTFGIHLVDNSGHAPGPMRALTRAGLSLVSFALFLSGFWLALFDRHGQTLHDKLTRTFVVRLSGA